MTKQRESLGTKRRWTILERDQFTCLFCGSRPGNDRLHVDHLLPHSLGGSDHNNNLATSCDRCNGGKGDRVAVPVSMLDGFISSDGWKTWRRWGDWHLMFDPSVMVLAFEPNGSDYWIPLDRIHEPDWHDHIQWKDWMREPADLEAIEAHHDELANERGRAWLRLDEFLTQPQHPLERRPARGERWSQFCDAISFARTLVRREPR